MRPTDVNQLRDDLIRFGAALEAPHVRAALVDTVLPRLVATLEMIPEAARTGDILELGATPYFLSLCLRRLCTGRIVHANYFGTAERRAVDRLRHQDSGETLVLESDLFNVETDDFPYPDASFDVVVFSELIEHLGVNPVRALSEIHRVLRPGGHVVITTPNFLSLERLVSLLRGWSYMVDRYSPMFGYGARHNREYHPRELRLLLEGCGFAIEAMTVRDLAALSLPERWHRALWRMLLRAYSDTPRGEHIFVRARRGDRFRWAFPPDLFDNIQFYTLVRYPWMEMGINDTIQTAAGWGALETAPDGRSIRSIIDTGQAFLKMPERADCIALEVYVAPHGDAPAAVTVTVWDRWLGRVKPETIYADCVIPLARGWQRHEIALGPSYPHRGDEIEVRLAPQSHPGAGSMAVHRMELIARLLFSP